MTSYYYTWTIGCQMNKADTGCIASYLEYLGYSFTPTIEIADVIVINSCVVRQGAEDKVVNKLNALRGIKRSRPETIIILTGCLVDSCHSRLKQYFPQVDLAFPPQDWEPLLEWGSKHKPESSHCMPFPSHSSISAFVPIIQGCNNFCSYCIVPYRRGREKSRLPGEIADEVRKRVQQGTKEVTLLGQNVNSYGYDLPHKPDLASLLEELNQIHGLLRIRFLTNHPKDMNLNLIQTMAHLDKVCAAINLPVQAGDDEILKLMQRGYTVSQYRSLVEDIRSVIPGISLSTDVIVGFPGETESQFEQTVKLIGDLRFDKVHVAAYSPRPQTTAWRKLEDNVLSDEKIRRREKIETLQKEIATQINARLLGKVVEVLVEGKRKEKWYGRTRTDKLVFFPEEATPGELAWVEVEKTTPWSLQGKMVG